MYITVIHSEVEIYRLPKSAYEKSIVANPLLNAVNHICYLFLTPKLNYLLMIPTYFCLIKILITYTNKYERYYWTLEGMLP